MPDYEFVTQQQQLKFAEKLIRSLSYLATTRRDKALSMEGAMLEALEDAGLELKEA